MSLDEGLDPHVARRRQPLRAVSRPQPDPAPDIGRSGGRPWRLLAPEDAVVLGPHHRREARGLPARTPVVLLADGLLAGSRVRRAAALAGIVVERELISLPSTRHPLVVLDEDDASIAVFWTAVAMVPPGLTRALAPSTLVLRAMTVAPPSLTRRLAPGRILIGHTR